MVVTINGKRYNTYLRANETLWKGNEGGLSIYLLDYKKNDNSIDIVNELLSSPFTINSIEVTVDGRPVIFS